MKALSWFDDRTLQVDWPSLGDGYDFRTDAQRPQGKMDSKGMFYEDIYLHCRSSD